MVQLARAQESVPRIGTAAAEAPVATRAWYLPCVWIRRDGKAMLQPLVNWPSGSSASHGGRTPREGITFGSSASRGSRAHCGSSILHDSNAHHCSSATFGSISHTAPGSSAAIETQEDEASYKAWPRMCTWWSPGSVYNRIEAISASEPEMKRIAVSIRTAKKRCLVAFAKRKREKPLNTKQDDQDKQKSMPEIRSVANSFELGVSRLRRVELASGGRVEFTVLNILKIQYSEFRLIVFPEFKVFSCTFSVHCVLFVV